MTSHHMTSHHITGEAALPLDARVVGVSHPVLLSVKDRQGRSRGFLRVETFWLDEAKPRKETGEFYYKVCTYVPYSRVCMLWMFCV